MLNGKTGNTPVADARVTHAPLRLASATAALIAANVVVFWLMALSGGHLLRFSGAQVLHWGANYGPMTMDGQLWRLASAMFVHIGLVHLLINMWCLYELGRLTEEFYGRASLLLLYGVTGLAGGIASLARNPTIVSAGASGAIFGLAGILITTLLFGKLGVPRRELMIALASLLAFAAYNLIYGFFKGGMDNGAHVGGLVSGLLIGIAVSYDARQTTSRLRKGVIYGVALAVLVAGYAAVKRGRGEVLETKAARQALANGDPDSALRRLNTLRTAPDNPAVQEMMAAAYAQKKQYAEAEKCYRRALQLDPRNFAARSGLGLLLADTGHLQEASKELEKALRVDANSAAVWLQLGRVLQKMGQHTEAVPALGKATALNPASVQAWFALGISEMNLRQYDPAVTDFQKATQLAPSNYDAQIWLANAYQAAGRTNEAAAAYMRAARLRRPATPRAAPAR